MKTKSQIISIRLHSDTIKQLDELCKLYGLSRAKFFTVYIQGQYDKLQGSPLMLEMLKTMNDITAKLSEQAKALPLEQQTIGKL